MVGEVKVKLRPFFLHKGAGCEVPNSAVVIIEKASLTGPMLQQVEEATGSLGSAHMACVCLLPTYLTHFSFKVSTHYTSKLQATYLQVHIQL